MPLTVCLITRFAAKSITAAVSSVAGVAQQVVVVDTGSKDETVSLAEKAGATAAIVPWNDDFAAVQNHALQLATGDWILWLNPDEELLPQSIDELRSAMARPEALAYMVIRDDIANPDRPDQTAQSMQLRLFRKIDGLHWVGRSHASLQPPLDQLARDRGQRIYSSTITLKRHAYLSPVTEPKLRWAAHLLELDLRERPDDLPHLIEYGRTLQLLNDPNAHGVYARAIEQVLPRLSDPHPPNALVAALLEYILRVPGTAYLGKLPQKDAPDVVLRWFPSSPPLLWALSEVLFANQDFRNAATLLEACVNLGRTGQYDGSQSFDPSIMGAAAQMNLGVCYARLGEKEKAAGCWRACLDDPRHGTRARELLGLATRQEK